MTELIRNSSHGNNIDVFYISIMGVYRKVSRDAFSKKYLINELDGYNWYADQQNKVKNFYIKDCFFSNNYSRLDIVEIKGNVLNYMVPISLSRAYVYEVIEHYISVWPKEINVPFHGDLTFDNIIFTNNGVQIIDWEHFSVSAECWGFDIVYLVLSAFILPKHKNKSISNHDSIELKKIWLKLLESGLSGSISRKPIDYFNAVLQSNRQLRKIKEDSPKKFYPLWVNKSLVNDIQSTINETYFEFYKK